VQPDPDPAGAFSSPRSTYEYSDYSENAADERPETLLQQARDLIKQGKREEAISVLRGIVLGFPNSSEAGLAKVTLEKAGISV
jgi:TolA-binding protein